MKGVAKFAMVIIGFALIFGILFVLGSILPRATIDSFLQPASIIPNDIGGCIVQSQGANYLAPFYGYLSCEALTPEQDRFENVVNVDDGFLGSKFVWNLEIGCPSQGGVAKTCDIYIRSLGQSSGSRVIGANYQVCTNNKCTSERWTSDSVFGGQEFKVATITSSQRIKLRGSVGLAEDARNVVSVIDKHISYVLRQFERGRATVITTDNCGVPNNFEQCVDCDFGDSDTPDSDTDFINNNPRTNLLPGETSSYLKDWVVTFRDTAFTTTYQGRAVDCSGRKLYDFETVRTENNCYAYPSTFIKEVNCCPGEKEAGKSCNNNFEWVFEDIGCIQEGLPTLTKCDYSGGWGSNFDGRAKRAVLCTSTGSCNYEFLTPTCTPPDIGCSVNQQCQGSWSDPSSFRCVGDTGACGDSDNDCFDDCTFEQINSCIPGCAKEGENTRNILGQKDKDCCPTLELDTGGFCKKEDTLQPDLFKALLLGLITSIIIYVGIGIILFVLSFTVALPTLSIVELMINPIVIIIFLVVGTLLFGLAFLGIATFVAGNIVSGII